MDRSAVDDPADPRGSDLAVADLPSTSGAHWANRDKAALRQRHGGSETPYRRPPAVNSFPGGESPSTDVDGTHGGWFGDRAGDWNNGTEEDRNENDWTQAEPAAPDYGPAPPTTPGRASFGFTGGPISPSGWSAVATDATTSRGRSAAAADAKSGGWSAVAADATTSRGRSAAAADATTSGQASPAYGSDAAQATAPEAGAGEFISGPGREIRPHRAARRDPAAHGHEHKTPRSTPHAAAPPRRSGTVMAAGTALAALVLLGGTVAGVAFFSGSDQSLDSVVHLGAGKTDGKTATAPLDGRTKADFDLVAATTTVTMKTQDLGDELYKITSADDSGTAPSPVLADDRVQLHLTPDGDGTSGRVEVLLSSKVRWALRFTGGADEQSVDLSGGRVSSIDVVGGARHFELSLPKPAGTVPVRVTGAVEDLSITSPKDSPVRVQVDSGAKTVAAGDRTLRDVRPGSTLTPKGWQVQNRYDVDAAARITLLSVDAR
ncbi:MAG TPA: hypothetical protein VGP91_05650 [Actinoplanes sp.]|nr:hypothetical protein [Actinoplanes sp.]